MTRLLSVRRGLAVGALTALLALGSSAAIGKDFGAMGAMFPVMEPDLLATIEARLAHLQATGGIDRANAMFARRAEARVRRPEPVAGISHATEPRSWIYDPSIVIDHDVRDQKGDMIAQRGRSVNPLDFVTMCQALVFVDGDSKVEMDWATSHYDDLKAKIILVNGAPLDEMTARKRRFYFDQEGRLTGRLGVRHTPAVVVQDGHVLKLSEIQLKGNG